MSSKRWLAWGESSDGEPRLSRLLPDFVFFFSFFPRDVKVPGLITTIRRSRLRGINCPCMSQQARTETPTIDEQTSSGERGAHPAGESCRRRQVGALHDASEPESDV